MNRINNSILFIFIIYTYNLRYIQWGLYTGTGNDQEREIGPFSFPIRFSSNVYSVHLELINNDSHNPESYDCLFQPRKISSSQFYAFQQIFGAAWFTNFYMTSFGK